MDLKIKLLKIIIQLRTGARETRDSPSTPPSSNPAYKIEATEEQDGMIRVFFFYTI